MTTVIDHAVTGGETEKGVQIKLRHKLYSKG